MSWATHDLEPYAVQRHLKGKVAIIPLLIGSYSPDMFTKWFVYGINVFGSDVGAGDAAQFHRGWPGVGFTHSLAFGVVIALIIYVVSRNKVWAYSFCIGQWLHAVSDTGDTMGTMLFFPFTTQLYSIEAWAYAVEAGRFKDAAAYFSGLGGVWDGFWIVYGLASWRVLTRSYFHETIVPADPLWSWAGRFLPEQALLALYRTSFFYGVTRWTAWMIWVHLVQGYDFDLTWGGPYWSPALSRG